MRTIVLAAGLTCVWLSPAAGDQATPPKGPAGGKIIFDQVCAPCHGKDARGTGPVAPSLKTPPADLTKIEARHGSGPFPWQEITDFIDGRKDIAAHGSREMPIWGDSLAQAVKDDTTRQERIKKAIQMLVYYLQTVQD
jgi:mono/diheme cytochrome c family protein